VTTPLKLDLLAQRHAAEQREALAAAHLETERLDRRRSAWTAVDSRTAWASPEQREKAMAAFFAPSTQPAYGLSLARRDAPDDTIQRHNQGINPYSFSYDSGRETFILVEGPAHPPDGHTVVDTLGGIADGADATRAAINTRRLAARMGRPTEPQVAESDAGYAWDVDARGNPVAVSVLRPMHREIERDTALEQVRAMADGASYPAEARDGAVAEIKRALDGGASEDVLAYHALVETQVPGPEGGSVRHLRLQRWTPDTPYPTPASHGPGTRVTTLRRLLEHARIRRDAVRYSGPESLRVVRNILNGERGR